MMRERTHGAIARTARRLVWRRWPRRPAAMVRRYGAWSFILLALLAPGAAVSQHPAAVFMLLVIVACAFAVICLPPQLLRLSRVRQVVASGKAGEVRLDHRQASAVWHTSGRIRLSWWYGPCSTPATMAAAVFLLAVGIASTGKSTGTGALADVAILSVVFTIGALGITLSRLATALLYWWCERRYLLAIMTVRAPSGRRWGVVVDRRSPISWSDANAMHATVHGGTEIWRRSPEPIAGDEFGLYLQ